MRNAAKPSGGSWWLCAHCLMIHDPDCFRVHRLTLGYVISELARRLSCSGRQVIKWATVESLLSSQWQFSESTTVNVPKFCSIMLHRSSLTLSLCAAVLLSPFLLSGSMAIGWSVGALADNQTDQQPPESMPSSFTWLKAHHNLLGILNFTTMANIQNKTFGNFSNG